MVNEPADFAADRFSDHTGNGRADKAKYYASQSLLASVCKRIAAVEASIREYATDVPQVAADVVATNEVLGEQRRLQIREARDRKIKRFIGQYGHDVVFVHTRTPPHARSASLRPSETNLGQTPALADVLVAANTAAQNASGGHKGALAASSHTDAICTIRYLTCPTTRATADIATFVPMRTPH